MLSILLILFSLPFSSWNIRLDNTNKLNEQTSAKQIRNEKKCNLSFKRDEIQHEQRVLRLLLIIEPTARQKSKNGKFDKFGSKGVTIGLKVESN